MTGPVAATTAGGAWGFALGALMIALGTHAIGGPVAPIAQLSILIFTTLPGAALGLLAHLERA